MKWWNIWRKWLTNEQLPDNTVRSVMMPRLEAQLNTDSTSPVEGCIRFGTLADVETFIHLEKIGYNGYLAWNHQDFTQDLQQNPYAVYLVLEVNNQVVGMISGRFTHKYAHISHLIVLPDYQRRGIGRQLLKLWLQMAQSQSILQASLEVRSDNEIAQHLYRQHGFAVKKEVLNYYGDGTSAIQMYLHLPTMKE